MKILIAEQQRENDRALRKAGRDIEREKRTLEVEENKIVSKCPIAQRLAQVQTHDSEFR